MITFHAIFARKHKAALAYPVATSFGSEIPIREVFAEICDPKKGEQFRLDHAELQLVIDMTIVEQLDFPDPDAIEAQRKKKALADALAAQAALVDARTKAAAAQEAAKNAMVAVKQLTPEQQALVNEHQAAEASRLAAAEAGKRAAEGKANAANAAEAERIAGADKQTAEKAAADKADAAQKMYESARSGLAKVDDAGLKLAASNYRVNVDGLERDAAIDAILTASGHKPSVPPENKTEPEKTEPEK